MSGFANNSILLLSFLLICTQCVDPEDSIEPETGDQLLEHSGESSSDPDPTYVKQNYQTSDCGGFPRVTDDAGLVPRSGPEFSYCDAELLKWHFDPPSSRLSLTHSRVQLNCCGSHSIRVKKDVDTYVVTEIDSDEDDRCRCVCVFDFASEFIVSEQQTINLLLRLHVTDQSSSPRQIYSGQLNLEDGSGTIVLNDSPMTDMCYE